ncbi:class II aldolase/adducin family protein [Actinoplanes sp. NPDC051851]|uniref:class II aldolase/adducin family protein n=1 Tax=Actinoplanes sp. NPDC051851 TaxID=3154753 RepID=UPI0034368DC5
MVIVDQLISIGRSAVGSGLVIASGGNLSARVPDTDHFVVTAAGTWLDALTPADFALLDLDGNHLGGPPPSSEWKLHHRAYRHRPDINAVVHVHPQHAVLLDALGHQIRLLTLDHAFYVRAVATTPYRPNGSDALADEATAHLTDHDCVIMSHHGCTTVGPTTEMAYRRALNLEEAAIATYRSLTLGDHTTTFPPDAFQDLHHS